MKKLAIAGIIALVVVGCIAAAGCTANTINTEASTLWAGAWSGEYRYDDGTVSPTLLYILPNGKETWMSLESDTFGPKVSAFYPGTWAKFGENDDVVTLTVSNTVDNAVYVYTYDKAKDTLTSLKTNNVYTRAEPFVGIWSGVSANKTGKLTLMLRPDGRGISFISPDDGTVKIYTATWRKNADGTFTITHSNGQERTYTVAADQKTMTSDDNRILTKQFLDTSLFSQLPGVWVNTAENYKAVFNGDGTGIYTGGNNIAHFTWKKAGNWKIAVTYSDGKGEDGSGLEGKTYTWTYNPETGELTDGDGFTFLRTTSGDGITFVAVSSASTAPWIGAWIGKTNDAVKYLKSDGTEVYMELAADSIGIRMNEFSTGTWKKIDDSTFKVIDTSTNTEYEYTYDKAADTIKSRQSGNVYARAASIVGIWSGTSSDKTGAGKSTMLFKPNGAGLATVVQEDAGTAEIYPLTWTKNADGTYTIAVVNGHSRIYTVAKDGKTMRSDDSRAFTKQFLDSTFLVGITGPWYNSESNDFVMFNADGTGFFNSNTNGVSHFTWKFGDKMQITLTYLDGKAGDGIDLKGKTYAWTYNPVNRELTSGLAGTFIRTTESVDGKFTHHF